MTVSPRNRWAVLVTVAAGLLLITLDNSILYTALPTLTRELGASQTQGLWIINAYPLVMAGLLLGAGTLGDRVGHRLMFLIGLVLFGIASLVAAFAPTANVLIAARAFLAVGAAAMMPATLALLRVSFTDEKERNFAIAIWGSISVIGVALGPIISGFLLSHFWWGSVFLVNVPVVALAFISTLIVAPRVAPDRSRHWDFVSSVLALVSLAALVIAIKETAHAGQSWAVPAAAAAIGLISTLLFTRRQSRLADPLLNFALFRNPAFLAGTLAAAFAMFAFAGLQLATTQRFQLVAGFTPMQAGILVSLAAIGSLPTAMLGGAFLHRIGLRILIAGGLAVATVGVLIATLGISHGIGWLIAGSVLAGAGVGAAMSVASTAIVGNAPVKNAGMAASVEEVSFEFGSLIAVALLGSLMAAVYSLGVVLPGGIAAAARDSLPNALSIADEMGADGIALKQAASTAFDRAFLMVMYVVAGVIALGALFTGVLLRSYGPGSQSSHYPH
ncbi:MFS transporter [Paracoccus sp. S4493]|jgi:DHA2 family multidrug resistance protein-like MFS transporter|uniref:Antiseptic resistance protein n=1 Tax=Phaeobacter piscinae TaxID=1580596 RepID=A0ABM6PKD5_9RHOB|nr:MULTISPECIES: MFS transporter [Rhodobacterales]MCE8001119.1 MFS transporter [Rhodobiaceae bacterium]PZP24793.1 MAG: MFS transporter [Kocuria rhizophila]ATG38012.1 Antiseptic resistance protein [Phaeobacter piscinae]AUQ88533.1 Antiseptic resistance protein [Phaeobacter piscinae]KJZ30040.1 MFS transporter [Paracoccus sp. S4493]